MIWLLFIHLQYGVCMILTDLLVFIMHLIVCCQKNISRFTSKNYDLTYFIALEPDSTFG